jgi:hypothetical protein
LSWSIAATRAGTSATTGTGPSGTGTSITDGGVRWSYTATTPVNIVAPGTPAPYLDTGVTQVLRAYNGGTSSSNCNAGCSGGTSTVSGHGQAVSPTSSW